LFPILAKAGIHSSEAQAAQEWVPAFAGTYSEIRFKLNVIHA
jgi:hypothetical protein